MTKCGRTMTKSDFNDTQTHSHLVCKRTLTEPFSQIGQMIGLRCEYVPVWCIDCCVFLSCHISL